MTLKHLTLPEVRRKKLNELLKKKRCLRILEVHNGLSGLVANTVTIDTDKGEIGFDGVWHSSFTDSAARGLPDTEIVSFDERSKAIQEVFRVTNKPMIVDGDTGGDPVHFEYLCTKLEQLGVSAIIIEDKQYPKRNSLEAGAKQDLEDPDLFATKIKRGKEVVQSNDFLIIARLESLIANKGVPDAMMRAKKYLEAGVDGIMIHSKDKDPADLFEFIDQYRAHEKKLGISKVLVVVPTTYNHVYGHELEKKGANIIIHANHLLRSAHRVMEQTARSILINDRSLEVDPLCTPVRRVFEEVGFLAVKEKDKHYAQKNIQAIILSAGKPEKEIEESYDLPIPELNIGGKTVIQRQTETLQNCGIQKIHCVVGYKKDKITFKGANLIHNQEWKDTFILNSLFKARKHMEDGFICINGDVVFNEEIIERLTKQKGDIVLVVDDSYKNFPLPKKLDLITSFLQRSKHKRILNTDLNKVRTVGKHIAPERATHEFTGIALFTKEGARILETVYEDAKAKKNGKFQEADSFEQASYTDILQEIINRGYDINLMEVHSGWTEVRNEINLKKAEKVAK